MRNILTVFLVTSLLTYLPEADREQAAKEVFHTFVIGVYFFPLLGGWLADRFFGKYHTIFWLSLVYCVGHACLALFVTQPHRLLRRPFLIALGSGGIKPCVAAFVGDQFDQTNKHRAKVVFDAFYWIINFGSFFASLLMPIFLRSLGPAVAFGIPGVLMFISTVFFGSARKQYVMVPPAPPNPRFVSATCRRTALAAGHARPRAGDRRHQRLAIGSFLLMPQFGFVSPACLALVAVIGFGGIGVWLQLDAVRGHTSRRSDRRCARGPARAGALRARDTVLVALRSESLDLGLAGERDDANRAGSSRRRCRRSIRRS